MKSLLETLDSAEQVTDLDAFVQRSLEHPTPCSSFKVEDGRIRSTKQTAVSNLKLITPDDEVKALAVSRGVVWEAGFEGRALRYWASDERPDSHGDIVRQSWVFDEFAKNSPMPWSHEWYMPPVGKVIDWAVKNRAEEDYTGPALELLGLYAAAGSYDWADSVYRLAKSGVLVAGSVGFFSDIVIDIKDPQEREKLGLGQYGYVLDQNHLLEFSPVTLGANSGAVISQSLVKGRKGIQAVDLVLLREIARRDCIARHGSKTAWNEQDTFLMELSGLFFPDVPILEHKSIDTPVLLTYEKEIEVSELRSEFDAFRGEMTDTVSEIRQIVSDIRVLVEEGAEPASPETTTSEDDEGVDEDSKEFRRLLGLTS